MIMNYEGILEFKGTWRRYQARVLEHADRYMADGKIHIVAAPGSGKTTLGIELIRRMNGKALILAPSITIREQWIARIEEAFLCEGVQGEDFLSQNLKQPKAITVATYQALHSAMTRFQGIQEDAGEYSGTGTDECLTENETEAFLLLTGTPGKRTFWLQGKRVTIRRCTVSVALRKQTATLRLDCQTAYGTPQPDAAQCQQLEELCLGVVRSCWQQGTDLLHLREHSLLRTGSPDGFDPTKNACPQLQADVVFLGA